MKSKVLSPSKPTEDVIMSPQGNSKEKLKESAAKKQDIWQTVRPQYKLIKFLGEGSFGTVKMAQCRATKKMVAIKLIKDFADCEYNCIKVAREVQIMRQICENTRSKNLFIPMIHDLVYH